MARWTSSIAPVLRGQFVSMLSVAILTTMIGQRSRAEMKANDVLSEVTYGATGTSTLDPMLAKAAWTEFYDFLAVLSADLGLAPFRAYLTPT